MDANVHFTKSGCRLRIWDAMENSPLRRERHGKGVLLVMDVPGASQYAEVYLDEEAQKWLGNALLRAEGN